MTVSCSVHGCKNRHNKNNPRQFFRFPLNNDNLLKLWLNAISRDNFNPTKASKVCSDHFVESDYLKRPGTYIRRLKPDAIPRVFPSHPVYLQKQHEIKTEQSLNCKEQTLDTDGFQEKLDPKFETTEILLDENILQETSDEPKFEMKTEITLDEDILEEKSNPKFTETPTVGLILGPTISATTQTDEIDEITLNNQINLLRKKVKTLNKKLRRKDATIKKLKHLIEQLRDTKPKQ